jgi:hypothetical protein
MEPSPPTTDEPTGTQHDEPRARLHALVDTLPGEVLGPLITLLEVAQRSLGSPGELPSAS